MKANNARVGLVPITEKQNSTKPKIIKILTIVLSTTCLISAAFSQPPTVAGCSSEWKVLYGIGRVLACGHGTVLPSLYTQCEYVNNPYYYPYGPTFSRSTPYPYGETKGPLQFLLSCLYGQNVYIFKCGKTKTVAYGDIWQRSGTSYICSQQ